MKSGTDKRTIIKNMATRITNLFTVKFEVLPLQFVRITEKFDVVRRSAYKTGFGVNE